MGRSESRKRRLTPWFPYRDAGSIESLLAHADVLDGISIFGATPAPEFFAVCRAHAIDTMLLVCGATDVFATPESARSTIEGYLRCCTEDGYGGIDMDFEHVPPEYTDAYAAFVRELSRALHDHGKRLGVCVGAFPLSTHGRPVRIHFFVPDVLADACDEVRVMCYDLHYGPHCLLGPTSTYPWAREGMQFWRQYVPPEKLIMGLPAYGNDYDMRPGAGFGRQVTYEHPAETTMGHAIEQFWLGYERINIYRYFNAERHPHLLYATDGKSTQHHLATVEECDLGGFAFWHYGTLTPSIWQTVYYYLRGQ